MEDADDGTTRREGRDGKVKLEKKQDEMDGWKSSSCEVGVDRTGRGWRIDLREPKAKSTCYLPYLNKVRNPELRTWLLGSCTVLGQSWGRLAARFSASQRQYSAQCVFQLPVTPTTPARSPPKLPLR